VKISICIPAFHRERMLVQALYSILIQEHEDYEVIIRDDGSNPPIEKDAGFCGIRPLFGNRLKYVLEPHLGTMAVANAVLKHATGDILYIMGSDDLLSAGALYAVNEAFGAEKFGGPFWLYGKTVSVDSHLRPERTDGAPTTFQQLAKMNRIGIPSTFWNRQIMNLAGPFDPRYKWATDYDMWLRFWRIREPIFLNQELGIYRHHSPRMCTEKTEEVEKEARCVSLRHSMMGDVIQRARNRWITRRAYGGNDIPVSHDEIG